MESHGDSRRGGRVAGRVDDGRSQVGYGGGGRGEMSEGLGARRSILGEIGGWR